MSDFKVKTIIFFVLFVLFVPLCGAYIIAYRGTAQDETIFVKNKERIQVTQGSMETGINTNFEFYVYSKDEIYKLYDTISFLHFRTYDVYNKLDEGKTCDVKTAGWRIPFLSMAKNIIEVRECY